MAGRGLAAVFERIRDLGFSITVVFVFLDTDDLCVRRVAERVRQGGHPVPEADVRRRFGRSKSRFWNVYRHLAHRWALLYNAGDAFVEVARGRGAEQHVENEALMALFLSDLS